MATLSGYMIFEEATRYQYGIHFSGAVTTAKVLIQLVADAAVPLEIVEVGVDGQSDTADAMEILIARYSGKSSSGTSFTPVELTEAGPAASADVGTGDTGVLFTTEGTSIADILVRRNVSVQAGGGFFWSRAMGPSRIYVPSAGIIGVKSNITIT